MAKEYELTKDEFLKRVRNHQMEILHDDGVYRHVRFGEPGTSNLHFHLVTFPGRLAYCGDMGSYMFSRLADMFEFFRRPDRGVNLSYWAEKVVATDRSDGVREFSLDKAKEVIRDIVSDSTSSFDEDEQKKKIAEELEELMESLDDEAGDLGDVIRITSELDGEFLDRHMFCDLWDHTTDTYTYRFQFACFAIAWGIEQYDKRVIAVAEPLGVSE